MTEGDRNTGCSGSPEFQCDTNKGELEFAINSYTDKCTVSVVESGSYLYTEWQH